MSVLMTCVPALKIKTLSFCFLAVNSCKCETMHCYIIRNFCTSSHYSHNVVSDAYSKEELAAIVVLAPSWVNRVMFV